MKKLLAVILCSLLFAAPSYAALSAGTIWEVETGAVDTNGGAFDPTQTAGMFTDLACTSATSTAPVCSSASYNFVAGDVAAWLYVASGTNWIAGWYKIASVASNQATLTATIGSAVLASSFIPSTAAGCATTASPTAATWTIDYSQQAAPKFTYTDLASVGAGLLVSSVAHPFAKQQVGNALNVASGTNFTAGIYVIVSVAAGVATVVGPGNITSGAGVSGVGSMGGAHLTWAKPFGLLLASNKVWIGTGSYSVSTTVTYPSGVSTIPNVTPNTVFGYNAVRGDAPTGSSRPTLTTSTSALVLLTVAGTNVHFENLIFDDNSTTGNTGVSLTCVDDCARGLWFTNIKVLNYKTSGILIAAGGGGSGPFFRQFEISGGATSCTGDIVMTSGGFTAIDGYLHSSACAGVNQNSNNGSILLSRLVTANHTTASGTGLVVTGALNTTTCDHCTFYKNAGDEVLATGSYQAISITNSAFWATAGTCMNFGFSMGPASFSNDYNAIGGGCTARTNIAAGPHDVTLTADPFTNGASGDFSPNGTAGGGPLIKSTGYPGVFPGATSTGYEDIGAIRHQDAGGSTVTVGYPSVR